MCCEGWVHRWRLPIYAFFHMVALHSVSHFSWTTWMNSSDLSCVLIGTIQFTFGTSIPVEYQFTFVKRTKLLVLWLHGCHWSSCVITCTIAENAPKKRKAILIWTKLEIIRDIRSGTKNADVAKKYDLLKWKISTILKDENKLHTLTNLSGDENKQKRLHEATYKDVDDALFKWFLDARGENIPISGPMLIKKADDIAFLLGHQDLKPGGRWLQRFKECHGIIYRAVVGEAVAVNEDAANGCLLT